MVLEFQFMQSARGNRTLFHFMQRQLRLLERTATISPEEHLQVPPYLTGYWVTQFAKVRHGVHTLTGMVAGGAFDQTTKGRGLEPQVW